MKNKETIFNELAVMVHELFEVPLEDIKYDSRFYEDLALDSIDAIDLIGQVQDLVGERLNPEQFKQVRTVGDIVEVAQTILAGQNESAEVN